MDWASWISDVFDVFYYTFQDVLIGEDAWDFKHLVIQIARGVMVIGIAILATVFGYRLILWVIAIRKYRR